MDEQDKHPGEEVKRLQRCINDLVSLLALPALWSGGDPSQIARTLMDVLHRLLHLDLIYVQLKGLSGAAPVELARIAQSPVTPSQAREIGAELHRLLGDDPQKWPSHARRGFRNRDMCIVPLRLGLHGETGTVVAGAERADFPGQTEQLLLRVAANQAVLSLHEARLLGEQKRLANELDQRVVQRTAELAAAMHDWKQAQEALRNTQAEMATMAHVMTVGELTASIAHEVNQPLSGIITNASTCLRMLDADPPNIEGARETARRTIRDGNRASEVIARLRALFSRRQATTEPVDLNEATKEVIALLLNRLQRDGVVLRYELADDLPLIAGDRVQLQQVIMNLLQNASDATSGLKDRSRQLLIQTHRDETDHVRLTVRDNGIGLDLQAASRLFDAFYTTKNGGMGIGLSVSRWIVENHQGRIWAQPNDGPGATFSFSIPPEARSASQLSSAKRPAAKNPRAIVKDF